jgi:hypothetical protein
MDTPSMDTVGSSLISCHLFSCLFFGVIRPSGAWLTHLAHFAANFVPQCYACIAETTLLECGLMQALHLSSTMCLRYDLNAYCKFSAAASEASQQLTARPDTWISSCECASLFCSLVL